MNWQQFSRGQRHTQTLLAAPCKYRTLSVVMLPLILALGQEQRGQILKILESIQCWDQIQLGLLVLATMMSGNMNDSGCEV